MTEAEVRGLCLKSREIFLQQPILLELVFLVLQRRPNPSPKGEKCPALNLLFAKLFLSLISRLAFFFSVVFIRLLCPQTFISVVLLSKWLNIFIQLFLPPKFGAQGGECLTSGSCCSTLLQSPPPPPHQHPHPYPHCHPNIPILLPGVNRVIKCLTQTLL